ncbi:hypothetical protein N0V93_006979 [Gnomoniopsis smithogilvyi]|uniref:Inositol polyphosphate-related phosphatase domain-containing protein n=1 Tax=Gnomoniopsis smithogilvyi TaxID=1191159 RepID=A0A9W9CV82_9PEZI|nr:hypothetical protein N0V93_006979 [Gnomoniopsis smithogilvyi]
MDTTGPANSASDTTEPADLSPSNPRSLHRAVFARRAEYTRPHRIRVKVGSWNVAACPGADKDLASWFIDGKGLDARLAALDLAHNPTVESQPSDISVDRDSTTNTRLLGGDQIGLYVLGLQEVVNLNPVTQYVYSDTNPTDKWRSALEAALPKGYQFIASEQMSGLLMLLYASPEVAPCIGSVSTKVVGTGVGGWFGNKGATAVRILLGETTKMVLVNSHLSSGSDASALERRCWDIRSIADRIRFDPISLPGQDGEGVQDKVGDEDCVFWFGDLNFRLDSIPGDDIRRLLTLHTRGEYGSSGSKHDNLDGEEGIIVTSVSDCSDEQTDDASASTKSPDQSSDDDSVSLPDPDDFEADPHEDPTSLQATLDSLLPHDQLRRMMKQGKVFHAGWQEGAITFLPSYKYDVGTIGLFDSSEKKRAPSWCDRILFRTKADKESYDRKTNDVEEARKRDEEMKARGIDHAADDDEVLFDYDPDNDGDSSPDGKPDLKYDEYDEAGDGTGPTSNQAGGEGRLKLDIYTSHQRITSSDHKPVVAIFTLDFDAVVPELKAEVLAEVARELDRAENEGRPSITIASEGSQTGDGLVDFGEIKYLDRREAHLTLANTGRVPASITFVDRPSIDDAGNGETSISQWLSTSLVGNELSDGNGEAPNLGKVVTLEPGETVTAYIKVLVDKPSQARVLNQGRERLEEVLVLRVADGRDHFLPVRAAWAPTCVGRSIDELIRVPDGGIRDFVASSSATKGERYPGAIPFEAAVHRSAPKELFRLIEALEDLTDRTIADEQMLGSYTIPKDKHGWPFEDFITGSHDDLLSTVIDILDTDRPIADAFPPETNPCKRLETIADVLLLFLEGLTDGIISKSVWEKIEQAPIRALEPPGGSTETSEDDKMMILDILANSPNHNICFVFLTTTLAKVVGELAPVRQSETNALNKAAAIPSSAIGAIARRSLSLRRSVTGGTNMAAITNMAEAVEAVQKRKAGERRVAQIFGKVLCRVPAPAREKDRKGLEVKAGAVVELFLKARNDGR